MTCTTKLTFNPSGNIPVTVQQIKEQTSGLHSVQRQLQWISEKRLIPLDEPSPPKYARDAVLLDQSGHIALQLPFWNEQIDQIEELRTFSNSHVAEQAVKQYPAT